LMQYLHDVRLTQHPFAQERNQRTGINALSVGQVGSETQQHAIRPTRLAVQ